VAVDLGVEVAVEATPGGRLRDGIIAVVHRAADPRALGLVVSAPRAPYEVNVDHALHRRLEVGFALLLLAILAIFFAVGLTYPVRPRELPLLVDGIGIVLVLTHLAGVLRRPAREGGTPGAVWNWRPVFLCFGSLAAYLAATLALGMVLSSAIIVCGCGVAFGGKNRLGLAMVAASTVVTIHVLFGVALGVPLYRGLVAELVW
jgi:hypothetical protein